MNFTQRRAESADEGFLFLLYTSTRADEIAAWGWDETQQTVFLEQQFSARESQYRSIYPDALHQIILMGNEPIGRILTSVGATEICLVDIAILPNRRGAGIGARLIRDLLLRAKTLGKAVVLSVTRDNRAAGLYERLGFVVTADDGVYLGMRWDPATISHQRSK